MYIIVLIVGWFYLGIVAIDSGSTAFWAVGKELWFPYPTYVFLFFASCAVKPRYFNPLQTEAVFVAHGFIQWLNITK